VELLRRVLASPDYHARAAAVRVLCCWRDRVADALPMLKQLAADKSPRVRLEAVRAASFFTAPDGIEVPLIASELPMDEYITFVRGETMRVLQPIFQSGVAKGEKINFTTEVGPRYMLRSVSVERLLTMKRTRVVDLELLYRPGVRDEVRREALRDLAKLENKNELKVLMEVVSTLGNQSEGRDESVVFDLIRLLSGRSPAELAEVRAELEKLATA